MNEAGIINQSTNRIFDLSWVDRKFIAYAIEYNFHISTNDNDIIDFLDQQFDLGQNKEPLSLINSWISSELIQWDPNHQSIVEDWDICNEPVQSRGDIEEFEYLTEYESGGEISVTSFSENCRPHFKQRKALYSSSSSGILLSGGPVSVPTIVMSSLTRILLQYGHFIFSSIMAYNRIRLSRTSGHN